jgi:histidinol-phosphate aminotransferase
MHALTRRDLGRLMGASVAAAAVRPLLAKTAPAPVRLSANENPYGPSPAALEAMRAACGRAWRYPDEAAGQLVDDLSRLHGLPREWFLLGDGSSEILKLAASAYPGKLVMAEPTFEAIGAYAKARGSPVVTVPLDATFAHDLARMQAEGAALIYVCNPNNPTASVTPKARMTTFLQSSGASAVLVDEAYHHYADNSDYESVLPLVKKHAGLIVTRTFSKIYGMAGVRLGYAVAQPAVIEKLAAQAAWDSVNVIALAAGRASLADAAWAEQGRRRNAATRARLVADLGRRGFEVIPSETNFVMIDTRREVKPLIAALHERGVDVGRLFPALPKHLRVTLGKPDEMDRFLREFVAVTS